MNATETPSGSSFDPLVGWRVRVPSKSNPNAHWWVTVIEQSGGLIKVAGNKSAGKPWWTHEREITKMVKPANAPAQQRRE